VVGYGGAAGGGKTDLALGLALTRHRRSIIFRRIHPSHKGMIERIGELVTSALGRWNQNSKTCKLKDGRSIELASCQYVTDLAKFRGQPHDLIVFDEATEFLEFMFRFLCGWLRTTVEGQRCRVVLTFNPPTDAGGLWILDYFAPWLRDDHPNPALPGELRWYATVDGKEIERENGEPFTVEGEAEPIQPKSRTFFPAKLADNPGLANSGYRATLQALPEPLRSQLLFGDFRAGLKDDAWALFPTAWVKAAMKRWKAREKPKTPMTVAGLDVAHGGDDKTVLAPRYDDWIDNLVKVKGVDTPDGKSAAKLAMKHIHKGTKVNVDAIGWGAAAAEKLKDSEKDGGYGVKAIPVNVAAASLFRDRSGKFKVVNKRAEMFWRLREALDPDHEPTLCLPDDPELLADLIAHRYSIGPNGIQIESKDDIKDRINRSPDCADAVGLTCLNTGFGVF
jgi:hypothetical protein